MGDKVELLQRQPNGRLRPTEVDADHAQDLLTAPDSEYTVRRTATLGVRTPEGDVVQVPGDRLHEAFRLGGVLDVGARREARIHAEIGNEQTRLQSETDRQRAEAMGEGSFPEAVATGAGTLLDTAAQSTAEGARLGFEMSPVGVMERVGETAGRAVRGQPLNVGHSVLQDEVLPRIVEHTAPARAIGEAQSAISQGEAGPVNQRLMAAGQAPIRYPENPLAGMQERNPNAAAAGTVLGEVAPLVVSGGLSGEAGGVARALTGDTLGEIGEEAIAQYGRRIPLPRVVGATSRVARSALTGGAQNVVMGNVQDINEGRQITAESEASRFILGAVVGAGTHMVLGAGHAAVEGLLDRGVAREAAALTGQATSGTPVENWLENPAAIPHGQGTPEAIAAAGRAEGNAAEALRGPGNDLFRREMGASMAEPGAAGRVYDAVRTATDEAFDRLQAELQIGAHASEMPHIRDARALVEEARGEVSLPPRAGAEIPAVPREEMTTAPGRRAQAARAAIPESERPTEIGMDVDPRAALPEHFAAMERLHARLRSMAENAPANERPVLNRVSRYLRSFLDQEADLSLPGTEFYAERGRSYGLAGKANAELRAHLETVAEARRALAESPSGVAAQRYQAASEEFVAFLRKHNAPAEAIHNATNARMEVLRSLQPPTTAPPVSGAPPSVWQDIQSVLGVRRGSTHARVGRAIGETVGGFMGGWPGARAGKEVGGVAGAMLHGDSRAVLINILRRRGPTFNRRYARAILDLGKSFTGRPAQTMVRTGAIALLHADQKRRQGAYDVLIERVHSQAGSPTAMIDSTAALTDAMTKVSPETALAMQTAMARGVQHLALHSQPPTIDIYTKQALPVSNTAMDDFFLRLSAIQNPLSVLERAADGTLTMPEVEALQDVYPAIYNRISLDVSQAVQNADRPPPYGTRIQLSLLLGIPMDPSLTPESIGALHQRMAQTSNQAQALGLSRMPARSSFNTTSSNTITETQRLEQK